MLLLEAFTCLGNEDGGFVGAGDGMARNHCDIVWHDLKLLRAKI